MAFNFKGTGSAAQKNSGSVIGGSQADDPLKDVEYTGQLDKDSAAELAALQEGFSQRANAEKRRFVRATDSEFWFAVCFETREDKEKFLRNAGVKMNLHGDKYINGRDLAKVLGINMD